MCVERMFHGRTFECLVNQICEHASVICKLLANNVTGSMRELNDAARPEKQCQAENTCTCPQSALSQPSISPQSAPSQPPVSPQVTS